MVPSFESYRHRPPTLRSISNPSIAHCSLVHHCITCFRSMSASNTRSGGAAISISLTTASVSGLIRDVAIFLLQSAVFFFSRVRTLFLGLGLHKGLQTGKVALPEIPVLVQPGVDTPQRLGVQPVQPVSPFTALLHQARSPQQQVLRNRRTRNRKLPRDLSCGQRSLPQKVQHGAARRIGQRLEGCCCRAPRICSHTVTHNT